MGGRDKGGGRGGGDRKGAGSLKAKTLAQAEKRLRKAFPGAIIEFKGIDLAVAQAASARLAQLAKDYPSIEVTAVLTAAWVNPGGAEYAKHNYLPGVGSMIRLNQNHLNDATEASEKLLGEEQAGWLAVGTIEGAISHEFGHAVQDQYMSRKEPIEKGTIGDLVSIWSREAFSTAKGEHPAGKVSMVASRYGLQDHKELFAEHFTAARAGRSSRYTRQWRVLQEEIDRIAAKGGTSESVDDILRRVRAVR